MFWFFGHEACGILAPQPGIESVPPALESEVLTTGLPGKSPPYLPIYLSIYLSMYLSIYLCLVALGLRCCARAFTSCSERGLLCVAVCGLHIVVASLVAEHGL